MVTDDELTAMERELIEQMEAIRREYQMAIEPYVKQLARIRSLRPSPPMMVSAEAFEKAREVPGGGQRLLPQHTLGQPPYLGL